MRSFLSKNKLASLPILACWQRRRRSLWKRPGLVLECKSFLFVLVQIVDDLTDMNKTHGRNSQFGAWQPGGAGTGSGVLVSGTTQETAANLSTASHPTYTLLADWLRMQKSVMQVYANRTLMATVTHWYDDALASKARFTTEQFCDISGPHRSRGLASARRLTLRVCWSTWLSHSRILRQNSIHTKTATKRMVKVGLCVLLTENFLKCY